jgi:O-antigen ligase
VAFGVFLFLNFLLYVRPSEIIQPLLGLELYLVVILLCLFAAIGAVLRELWPTNMDRFTACVIAFTVAVFFSHLAHLRLEEAFYWAFDAFKVFLYFLLFMGLVTDKLRMRRMLFWLTIFISISALVSVLEFHGFVTLPAAAKIRDGDYIRLRGSGIFGDPNDLCVLLCLGILFGLYFLTTDVGGAMPRFFWLAPLALLFYSLLMTQSRGGLLALMVGLVALLRARLGWLSAVGVGIAVLPVLIILAGQRQAAISTETSTGHARIELWSDGLMLLRDNPIFGVGRDQYAENAGQVAHNSYLHAFAETGLFGGIFFFGSFAIALLGLARLCPDKCPISDPDLKRMQPFILGGVASYMTGMMTLTLTYLVPTFTVLALAATFSRMSAPPTLDSQTSRPKFDTLFLGRLVLVSVAFLAFMALFVRFARS